MKKNVILEEAAKKFVNETSEPPFLFQLGPEKGRQTVHEVQSGVMDKPSVDIEDLSIEGGPQGSVSVRLLRPQNVHGKIPVILYIHGAG
ncbi:hypothetical protein D3C73_1000390 [compost metagenome]